MLRSARFETYEARLVLSAQPLGDFFLDAELALNQQIEYAEVAPTLGDVHGITGVQQARDTYGFTGGGQTVAVIDSGIAYDHTSLGGGYGAGYRVVGGYDFAENDANPYDDGPSGFHGTHVAGIVGSDHATHNGVAPNVDLVALRVFNDQGAGYFSWVEDALQWVHQNRNAFDNPITTVNLSLGTNWNSDSVPAWAMLEDEFAQLEADGIFISVAAGNSFQSFNSPGLSYPAASPFVVPVASHGNDGTMSSFSQRNDRVIAAPGEYIASTVPSHLYGGSGPSSAFMNASGTSMAAPYVAAASVVLREAMEFLGYQNITQDMIYDHFRDTADMFFDPATSANYHRLNVEQALDTLMPDDDYGSSAAAAHSLGTLTDSFDVSGLIGQLDDRDFFTFTAAQTGVAHFTASTTHDLAADWQLVDGSGTLQEGVFSFDVVAGEAYTISLGTDVGLGYFDVAAELESTEPTPIEWGAVSFNQFADQAINGETWYQFSATRSGLLTVEAMFAHGQGNIDLEMYDGNGNLLAGSNSQTDNERIDVSASSGDTFVMRVVGGQNEVDFQLTNLVAVDGAKVTVFGTGADDAFTFQAGATHSLSVNGVGYEFDGANATTFNFRGGVGSDSIQMTGTAGDERVILRVGRTYLIGEEFQANVYDLTSVSVTGGGGDDVAYLYDSTGNDTLVARRDRVVLSGTGFTNDVNGFDRVQAYSTAGGFDTATLHDSAGDDQFIAKPDWASMRGEGYYNYARGFEQVTGMATGGFDRAFLHDSAGNDTLVTRPDRVVLSGAGFTNDVNGFDRVYAHATAGGIDTATLHDSAGDDRFIARPEWVLMRGEGHYNYAHGFEQATGMATSGGEDRAYFYDSAGDDALVARPDRVVLSGAGFTNDAQGFDRVLAYSTAGGIDTATLYDSAGDDRFTTTPDWALMRGEGYYNYARGFEQVTGMATAGGYDRSSLYDSAGNDTLVARPDRVVLSGDGFENRAEGFEQVNARASEGGTDVAVMYDSAGDDWFVSKSDFAYLRGDGFFNFTRGFKGVWAHADAGGNDRAYLYGTEADDLVDVMPGATEMNCGGQIVRAETFDRTLTFGRGGADEAVFHEVGNGNQFYQDESSARLTNDDTVSRVFEFEQYVVHQQPDEQSAEMSALETLFAQFGSSE